MAAQFLSDLNIGESGRIVKLAAQGAFRQRLMEMGLVRGVRIDVVRSAPLGDPIEYQIKGYRISLRKQEARLVHIEGAA